MSATAEAGSDLPAAQFFRGPRWPLLPRGVTGLRMIENRFVTTESSFIDMSAWDACVQPSLTLSMERVPIWVGIDASVKRRLS
jgi:hypothetical protein